MNDIINFGKWLNKIFIALLKFLPDSPFKTICVFVDEYDILGILNWIIPFDVFSQILNTWLACVTAYYVYCYTKGTLSSKNSLIFKIIETFLF
jgi:hypothetical protein